MKTSMRSRIRSLCAAVLAAGLIAGAASAAAAEIVRKKSPYSVTETIDRLEAILKKQGLTIFARVDHAAGAAKVGQTLRPTLLLIFGNPKAGTVLMSKEQTMGLYLPMKALAWQDASGQVWLGYQTPVSLAKTGGVSHKHPVVAKMTGALRKLTDAAVKK